MEPDVSHDPTEQDVDEAFRAVLEGLRTTLPGTQALFGFLLILPFQSAFGSLDTLDHASFLIAFLAAALSTVLLIAPSVHQRVRAPKSGVERRSRRHLRITVWVTIVGSVVFAVALAAAVFLVARVVLSSTAAGIAGGAIVLSVLFSWFYLPLVTFQRVR